MVETTEAASSGEGSDVHEEMAADVKEFLSQGIWLSDALIKRLEAVAFTEMDEIIEVCQGATDQGSRVLLGNVVDLLGPEWCQEHVKDIVRLFVSSSSSSIRTNKSIRRNCWRASRTIRMKWMMKGRVTNQGIVLLISTRRHHRDDHIGRLQSSTT